MCVFFSGDVLFGILREVGWMFFFFFIMGF